MRRFRRDYGLRKLIRFYLTGNCPQCGGKDAHKMDCSFPYERYRILARSRWWPLIKRCWWARKAGIAIRLQAELGPEGMRTWVDVWSREP